MCSSKFRISLYFSLALLGAQAMHSASVSAQPAELITDPSGAPPPAAAPAQAPVRPRAEGTNDGAASKGNSGLSYYGDYLEGSEAVSDHVHHAGVVPVTHTVRSGDTLWGLSEYYFRDAWSWPKIWGLNPEVTNPHWIYPGNILRLRKGGIAQSTAKALPPGTSARRTVAAIKRSPRSIGLRQVAYVDLKDLEDAGKVVGAVDDKALLSTGDSIYITYPKDNVPTVGQRFAVYRTRQNIRRNGKAVGAYVELTGELEIAKIAKDKRARAVLIRSVQPVERGMSVGPLRLNFTDVEAVINKKKVDGHIAQLIGPDQLIGTEAAIIIDRGRKDGVLLGNRFLVIRRGDAYRKELAAGNNVGQDDDRYPARAIGEIKIVQTGESASMGIVTFSVREFGVGDRVFMRKGK